VDQHLVLITVKTPIWGVRELNAKKKRKKEEKEKDTGEALEINEVERAHRRIRSFGITGNRKEIAGGSRGYTAVEKRGGKRKVNKKNRKIASLAKQYAGTPTTAKQKKEKLVQTGSKNPTKEKRSFRQTSQKGGGIGGCEGIEMPVNKKKEHNVKNKANV